MIKVEWFDEIKDLRSEKIEAELEKIIPSYLTFWVGFLKKEFNLNIYIQGSNQVQTNIANSEIDVLITIDKLYSLSELNSFSKYKKIYKTKDVTKNSTLTFVETDRWENNFNKSFVLDKLMNEKREAVKIHLKKLRWELIKILSRKGYKIEEHSKYLKISKNEKQFNLMVSFPYIKVNKDFPDLISAGIIILDQDKKELIINYPKYEWDNINKKNSETNNSYKEICRFIKNYNYFNSNCKFDLSGYTIELLLYNLPNSFFVNDNLDFKLESIKNISKYLADVFYKKDYSFIKKSIDEISNIEKSLELKQIIDQEELLYKLFKNISDELLIK